MDVLSLQRERVRAHEAPEVVNPVGGQFRMVVQEREDGMGVLP